MEINILLSLLKAKCNVASCIIDVTQKYLVDNMRLEQKYFVHIAFLRNDTSLLLKIRTRAVLVSIVFMWLIVAF